MTQQGQVIQLKSRDRGGNSLWAYRCRLAGRGSKRVQRGGFATESDARAALGLALERARRERGTPTRSLTLTELVDEYLAQHDVEPTTLGKLRWLLGKAVDAFGDCQIAELRSPEIAAWRMTIAAGHRFEATQALRQVLARAVDWGLIDINAAKVGVGNPQRRPTEMRPFESWAELEPLRRSSGPATGRW